MNNTNKIIMASSVGFALGIGFCLMIAKVFQRGREVQQIIDHTPFPNSKPDQESLQKTEGSAEVPLKDDSFPLEFGSQGERVNRLQIYLMRKLGWIRKPSGIVDAITLERMKKGLNTSSISEEAYHKLGLNKMVHDQHKTKTE